MHKIRRNEQEHARNIRELAGICIKHAGMNRNMHITFRN